MVHGGAALALSRPPPAVTAQALVAAQQAAPDAFGALMDLHLAEAAYRANSNATALRGANAASAALLCWMA
jgi:hypothetical protein